MKKPISLQKWVLHTVGETVDQFLYTDLYAIFKQELRKEWEDKWLEYVSTSSNNYIHIYPKLPARIPQTVYNMSREISVTITRLRINHGRFPAHLHRIGVVNDPNCECDDTSAADLNHIFFACPLLETARTEMLAMLQSLGVHHPLNLATLLALENKRVYFALVRFLRQSKIQL